MHKSDVLVLLVCFAGFLIVGPSAKAQLESDRYRRREVVQSDAVVTVWEDKKTERFVQVAIDDRSGNGPTIVLGQRGNKKSPFLEIQSNGLIISASDGLRFMSFDDLLSVVKSKRIIP